MADQTAAARNGRNIQSDVLIKSRMQRIARVVRVKSR